MLWRTRPELTAAPRRHRSGVRGRGARAGIPPGGENRSGGSARYLWVILLARIYEAFPLTCPRYEAEMRIIAFITEGADVEGSWMSYPWI